MGLLLRALIASDPRGDGTDDRLSASLDADVLDGDALLPLATVAIQGFAQSRESPGEPASANLKAEGGRLGLVSGKPARHPGDRRDHR
jgi:hypothetical protein